MNTRAVPAPIVRFGDGRLETDQDLVVVEAPLLLRLTQPGAAPLSLGLLLRTPGHDEDLVRGLLLAEGIIDRSADLLGVTLRRERLEDGSDGEVADARLSASIDLSAITRARALVTSSACGLCGRLELSPLAARPLEPARPRWTVERLTSVPDLLRAGQTVFAETGGLHAAVLVDRHGSPLVLREDIGRHNAVDKVIGTALSEGLLPAPDGLLGVSGRVAYEIVQKAARAGIGAIVAVGAPSSLAVDAARRARVTLVGFVRDGRFNVYAGAEHVED